MPEDFTIDVFSSRHDQPYFLEDEQAGTHELVLAECTRLGDGGTARVPFSLVFRGPVDPVLPQRTYPLRHAELGAFELFLVPVGRDATGTSYEAVFT